MDPTDASLTWVEISIAAGVFLTLRNALARTLSGRVSPVLISWARFAFNLPFSGPAVLMLMAASGLPQLSFAFYGYCFLTGVTQILANIALVSAFQHTNFAQAIVLHKLEVLFTALCGVVFFAEHPSALGWVGISASSLGVMLMNLGKAGGPAGWRRALHFDWGALLAVGCAVFLVFASFLLKEATTEFAVLNPHFGTSRFEAAVHAVFHTTWMEVVLLTAYLWWLKREELPNITTHWRRMSLIGAASFGGSICAFWSYSLTLVVYAKAVAQIEAVVAIGLALVLWGEQEVWRQLPGMVLVVSGIALILLG